MKNGLNNTSNSYNRVLTVALLLLPLLLSACGGLSSKDQDQRRRIAEDNFKLGLNYMKQGKFDWAVEKFLKSIDAQSDYAPAHSALAITYENLGQYDDADDHYQSAIDHEPNDGALKNNYGVFLCKHRRFDEALENFMGAVKSPRYRTPELAYENAGTCARLANNMEQAEIYLRQALQINPRLPKSLFNMLEVMVSKENWMSSRAYLQRLGGVSAHNSRSLWLGIKIERKLGDTAASRNYAKRLQTEFPDSLEFKELIDSMRKRQKGQS